MNTFDMTLALNAAKEVKTRVVGTTSKFDSKIVMEIIEALGGATPSQVCVAYNAGMKTELKSKVFCDWMWGQAKRGILVNENGIYKVVKAETTETKEESVAQEEVVA